MKKHLAVVLFAVVLASLLIVVGCGQASEDGNGDGKKEEDILAGMSLEEKVGQLFMIGVQGTEMTSETQQLLQTVHPGGVILFGRNIQDAGQLTKLVADLQSTAAADTGQPLFISTDQEGGEIVRIKWLDDNVAEADITSTDQAYQIGLKRGQDLKSLGINQNLAPVLDMCQPDDFLMQYKRCFPGDPQQMGELGKSVISGQRDGGILSTAKHFPGYGGIVFDPENEQIPTVSQLPETSQFEVAAEAGPEFIMTANVVYEDIDADVPFTLTPAGIEFLRKKVGGDYLIITDDLASKVLKAKYGMGGTVVMAAKAGNDILLISANQPEDPEAAYNALLDAVKNGEIGEDEIDKRVTAILRLKERISSQQ
jgi:beta-N-acetylhexosaminidase